MMVYSRPPTGSTEWRSQCMVVIVHYGELDPTQHILRATLAMGFCAAVVGNDDTPDPEWAGLEYRWLRPGRNLGYGGGFNFAVCHCPDFEYFLLSNNDLVLNPSTLDACAEMLVGFHDVGAVAPRLVLPSGNLQHGPGALTRFLKMPVNSPIDERRIVSTQWLTGALVLVRGDAARNVQMDGSYFLGCEDADYGLALISSGYKSVYRGDVTVVHQGGGTIGAWWYYYAARNPTWFAVSNFGLLRALLVWIVTALKLPRILCADVLKQRGLRRTQLTILGLRHAIRRKPSQSDGPWMCEPVPSGGER